jgi:hypothetical protein
VQTITAPESGSARSGRQVDDEVVELAPLGLRRELLERAVRHRTAPDERLVGIDQLADGHGLDAVDLEREQHVAASLRGLVVEPEHRGRARSVDVAVEEACAGAHPSEGHGEVDGHRRLADAALARAHGDDLADPGKRIGTVARPLVGTADIGREDEFDARAGGAERCGLGLHGRLDVGADLVLHGTGGRRELDRDVGAVALHAGLLHHPERDEVLPDVGVEDGAEGVGEVFWGQRHGGFRAKSDRDRSGALERGRRMDLATAAIHRG